MPLRPGFPIIPFNPIPILKKYGSEIFNPIKTTQSEFVIENVEVPISGSTGAYLIATPVQNFSAKIVGD